MTKTEEAKDFLLARQQSYRLVFNPENNFTTKVLEDLARFCRADDSTFHPDERVHALMEGRREVFLRIQQHLKLDLEDLWKKYGRKDSE